MNTRTRRKKKAAALGLLAVSLTGMIGHHGSVLWSLVGMAVGALVGGLILIVRRGRY